MFATRSSTVRRDLPDDVEPPVIDKLDPDAAPILAVALSGTRSIRELTEYADDVVKERLERVNGVGSVEIVGGREREIRVWMSMDRLSAYDLTVDDVVRALRLENLEVPGGRIETGPRELVVRTRGRIQNPDEFDRIVIMQRPTGPIYLQDVALVEDGMADERSLSRLNGERAVSLLIRRQSGTNAVAVAHEIKSALAEIERILPDDYSMVIANDTSDYIEENINDVKFHLVFGGGLAVLVIFFFLRNISTTLISAVAIPTSIIGTFFVIEAFGFSLEHDDHAGPFSVGGHPDRRRHRGHREHLSPHGRGENPARMHRRSPPRRSGSRSWRPLFPSSPFSFRWPSWKVSSDGSSTSSGSRSPLRC